MDKSQDYAVMPKDERELHKTQALAKRQKLNELNTQTTTPINEVPSSPSGDIISKAWAMVDPNDVLPMTTMTTTKITLSTSTSQTSVTSLTTPTTSNEKLSWPEWVNTPGLDLPSHPLLGQITRAPKITMATGLSNAQEEEPIVMQEELENQEHSKLISLDPIVNTAPPNQNLLTTQEDDNLGFHADELVSMERATHPLHDGSHFIAITPAAAEPIDNTPPCKQSTINSTNPPDQDIMDCSAIPVVSWDMVTACVNRIQNKSLNTGLHTIPEIYNLVREVEDKLDVGQMTTVQQIIDSTFRK